jgi:hypothetical protein
LEINALLGEDLADGFFDASGFVADGDEDGEGGMRLGEGLERGKML